jgi:hypothetical protein
VQSIWKGHDSSDVHKAACPEAVVISASWLLQTLPSIMPLGRGTCCMWCTGWATLQIHVCPTCKYGHCYVAFTLSESTQSVCTCTSKQTFLYLPCRSRTTEEEHQRLRQEGIWQVYHHDQIGIIHTGNRYECQQRMLRSYLGDSSCIKVRTRRGMI